MEYFNKYDINIKIETLNKILLSLKTISLK